MKTSTKTYLIILIFAVIFTTFLALIAYGKVNHFFDNDSYTQNLQSRTGSEAEKIATGEVSDNNSSSALRILETTDQIKNYIVEVAEYYGVDKDLALRIAFCESTYRNVCNIGGCEYGQGIYQFVLGTWNEQCEGDIDNPKDNIDCAIKLFSKGEYWRWNSSKGCWE